MRWCLHRWLFPWLVTSHLERDPIDPVFQSVNQRERMTARLWHPHASGCGRALFVTIEKPLHPS